MPKRRKTLDLYDGYTVKNDQTKSLRKYYAAKKVRGKLLSACKRGCGRYLSEDEEITHECSGPPDAEQMQIAIAAEQYKQEQRSLRAARKRSREQELQLAAKQAAKLEADRRKAKKLRRRAARARRKLAQQQQSLGAPQSFISSNHTAGQSISTGG